MNLQPELDYMSRLVLTKIDLASDKFFPRDVLKSWMTTGSRYSCSPTLIKLGKYLTTYSA